ncbi:MAG: T9SS type A sorting domain-containing protein [Ignavibacteriae bacterium]|nr:T9SS type A sorting domain-containing protein [Ignavibacteriota bacterium]
MRLLSLQCRYALLLTALWSNTALAQPFLWQVKPSFTVSNSWEANILNPFTGGMNVPIVQFVDIDGDGDYDLYLLDSDRRLNFYENIGSTESPKFVLRTLDLQDNTGTRIDPGAWFRLVDIDNDGDRELFCNTPVSFVKFYRNTGTPQSPVFTLVSSTLQDDNGDPILSESISIPTFADADGDGDMDFFSGYSNGAILYYENIDTTEQSFLFHYVTDQYQGITIIGMKKVEEGSEGLLSLKLNKGLHGAMALDFVDIDGDGDLDMFWGDFFNTSLYRLENTGTPTQPQFVLTDSTFPKPNIVQTNGFNMPQFVDIDGDGDLDMFISVLSGASLDNFRFYSNTGMPENAGFELVTSNFISTIDHGAASSPVFADIDGDGDLDLVIGNENGELAEYIREGTGAGLQFTLSESPTFAPVGFFNASPDFGDIDGDGQIDLIFGEANGKIHLYRRSNPASEDTAFPLRATSFGQNAAPVLVDFDGDGDFDLFIGTGGGTVHYYRNDGTEENLNFVLVPDFLASIDVGDDAKPVFLDDDGDGDLDLVVGSRNNSLFYYQNTGDSFTLVDDYFADVPVYSRTAPAFDDVDGDGDFDLFLGNYRGGLLFYRNDNVTGVDPMPVPQSFLLEQNYPNPFNAETVMKFRLSTAEHVSLRVYDVLGREIAVLTNGRFDQGLHVVRWNAKGFASGVYVYRLQAGKYTEVRKAILLR